MQLGIAHELSSNKVLATNFLIEDYDHKQQNLRDAHRYGVSGNYRFAANNSRYQLGLSLGHERPDQETGKHYTRNTTGIAYSAEHTWDTANSSFISTQFQYRKHRAPDPVYAKKRKDKRLLFKIGHTMRVTKNWSVFANIGYTKNSSNLDIYDTDRAFAQLGVNYNF
jgi:predicted porin